LNLKCAKGFKLKYAKKECCPKCIRCNCPKEFNPVCSTSGVTFKNSCDAKCQGFNVKHFGSCKKPCNGKCPKTLSPVCGSDKKTYKNGCVLQRNKVKLLHVGTCSSPIVKDPRDKRVTKKNNCKKKIKNMFNF